MPKFDEIGPNESARMIVRGTLFGAPSEMREKYSSFVYPFSLGGDAGSDIIPEKENSKLEQFVKELSAIAELDEVKLAQIPEQADRIKIVSIQVREVLEVADRYTKIFKYYDKPLATITENIRSRKIVDHGDVVLRLQEKEKVATEAPIKNSKSDSEHLKLLRDSFQRLLDTTAKETNLESFKPEDEKDNLEDFLDDEKDKQSYNK